MLSPANRGYASTCQTIGLNVGYFVSYTGFLAMNSNEFCTKYLGLGSALMSLGNYLQLCGAVFLLFTLWLTFAIHEGRSDYVTETETINLSAIEVYRRIVYLLKQTHVRELITVLLIARVGFAVTDNVLDLTLLNRGVPREDLAIFALVGLPFQIVFAVLAGRWSSGSNPLNPWLGAYFGRLIISAVCLVSIFMFFPAFDKADPSLPVQISWLQVVFVFGLMTSFSFVSSVMLVSQGGFFNRISDSTIGATYVTLLNTIANFGGTWPKFFSLYFVDLFTTNACYIPPTVVVGDIDVGRCSSQAERKLCVELGGSCLVINDGFFLVGSFCLVIGCFLLFFLKKKVSGLQKLTVSEWSFEITKPK